MVTHVIDINMDAKCKLCGKPGAIEEGGYCLDCIAKNLGKAKDMSKSKSKTPPAQSPNGEAIEFENCGVAGVKADLVSGGVKITIGVSFSQLPPDVRARLAQISELEQPVRITIQPMQMSLNLGMQHGKLD